MALESLRVSVCLCIIKAIHIHQPGKERREHALQRTAVVADQTCPDDTADQGNQCHNVKSKAGNKQSLGLVKPVCAERDLSAPRVRVTIIVPTITGEQPV